MISNLARRKFQIIAGCHWMCFHTANFDISDFCIYCLIATCMFNLKIFLVLNHMTGAKYDDRGDRTF